MDTLRCLRDVRLNKLNNMTSYMIRRILPTLRPPDDGGGNVGPVAQL